MEFVISNVSDIIADIAPPLHCALFESNVLLFRYNEPFDEYIAPPSTNALFDVN